MFKFSLFTTVFVLIAFAQDAIEEEVFDSLQIYYHKTTKSLETLENEALLFMDGLNQEIVSSSTEMKFDYPVVNIEVPHMDQTSFEKVKLAWGKNADVTGYVINDFAISPTVYYDE